MRMPRFQFTLRRLMIAVAAASIILYAVMLKRRRDDFLERAAAHSSSEATYRYLEASCKEAAKIDTEFAAMVLRGQPLTGGPTVERAKEFVARMEKDAASYHDEAARHENLKRRYDYLARHPWLPVASHLRESD